MSKETYLLGTRRTSSTGNLKDRDWGDPRGDGLPTTGGNYDTRDVSCLEPGPRRLKSLYQVGEVCVTISRSLHLDPRRISVGLVATIKLFLPQLSLFPRLHLPHRLMLRRNSSSPPTSAVKSPESETTRTQTLSFLVSHELPGPGSSRDDFGISSHTTTTPVHSNPFRGGGPRPPQSNTSVVSTHIIIYFVL